MRRITTALTTLTAAAAVSLGLPISAHAVTIGEAGHIAVLGTPPDQANIRQPVIDSPKDEGTTGLTPYFEGSVPGGVPAGTTLKAMEGGKVVADNVRVDPVTGAWNFVRGSKAGDWSAGDHTVTVTASYGQNVSAPATVTFTVAGIRQPVIDSPKDEGTTGLTPYFEGSVPGGVPAGTTLKAMEGGKVVADNVRVDPVTGAWNFVRGSKAGDWSAGDHTVTVTASYGQNVSAPATVTFTVAGIRQPVIDSPKDEGTTGLTPYFEGSVPGGVPAGTTLKAMEGGKVVADNVRVDPVTGAWNFVRGSKAGDWSAGDHTVTVTASYGQNVSAPATVTFTVAGIRQPVIDSPKDEGTTGLTPYFEGSVPGGVPAGTTLKAMEGGKVVADNVRVDPVTGAWNFVRGSKAGDWSAGDHTVTVTASYGQNVSAPATVTFTVRP